MTGGEALEAANNRIAADREAGCCNSGYWRVRPHFQRDVDFILKYYFLAADTADAAAVGEPVGSIPKVGWPSFSADLSKTSVLPKTN